MAEESMAWHVWRAWNNRVARIFCGPWQRFRTGLVRGSMSEARAARVTGSGRCTRVGLAKSFTGPTRKVVTKWLRKEQ